MKTSTALIITSVSAAALFAFANAEFLAGFPFALTIAFAASFGIVGLLITDYSRPRVALKLPHRIVRPSLTPLALAPSKAYGIRRRSPNVERIAA